MPLASSSQTIIQRKRQQAQGAPPNPPNRKDMIIPQKYQETKDGRRFLLYDSGNVEDRVLIFATDEALALLAEAEDWFADGTFDVSTELFYQVYTVHAFKDGRYFPCVFALLPNKQEATYVRFLDFISNINGQHLSPKTVMTDFEKGAINAFEEIFPDVDMRACFFHLAQSCFRQVQHMPRMAEADGEFKLACKMIPALAMVPPTDVEQAFKTVGRSINAKYPELFDYLVYFEKTYVGGTYLGRYRAPLFPIQLWNQYDAVLKGLPRTNNGPEGFHRGFQSAISCKTPTIWKLIDALKNEESLRSYREVQQEAGEGPPAKRPRVLKEHQRIFNKVSSYGPATDVESYLRGVAYNVNF